MTDSFRNSTDSKDRTAMAAAAAADGEEKKVRKMVLKSCDGEEFVVEEAVAIQSGMISNLLEVIGFEENGSPLPIQNVTASVLSKVLDYCRRHAEAAPSDSDDARKCFEQDLKLFDDDLVNVDYALLFDLILAANYLDIGGLMDLACQAVANKIKDKSPEEVRQIFNIENDFTPEEEMKVRKENEWAFS